MRSRTVVDPRRFHLDRAARLLLLGALLGVVLGCAEGSRGTPLPGMPKNRDSGVGLLALLPANGRYFTDMRSQRPVYLTGSHTWNTFQDWGLTDPPDPLDYAAYLDFLERHGHNFIRLYVWEQAAWFPGTEAKVVIVPLPYLRTGPDQGLDGHLRFDVTQFDPRYFRRLRERVEAAGARGIYVSVMLFNGWSVELKGQQSGNPWRGHPFNRANNVNGIDGDADGDGEGKEVHTLLDPAVTALQKAYLGKVSETLGDLDNVLWEISNESHPRSAEWQYEMIRTLREFESGRGKQHPIGMTSVYPHGKLGNRPLFESPADWISPHDNACHPYKEDPPAPTPSDKIVVSDTDHLWGVGGHSSWVWKSFLRGLNPIFMDPYVTAIRSNLPAWSSPEAIRSTSRPVPTPEWESVRMAMGYTRAVTDRVELASMRPMEELASTGYCLAAPGKEYLVYLPQPGRLRRFVRWLVKGHLGEGVEVDLSAAPGALDVEWVDVERGLLVPGNPVKGGRRLEFRAPFAGAALLHLRTPTNR
jgi:hypothetical protein